jgi:large subunit ribosomal protein L29
MRAKEIRDKSEEELQQKIIELKKDLIKEYAQVATGTQLKSPGQIKKMNKTIARIHTIIHEKNKEKKEEPKKGDQKKK